MIRVVTFDLDDTLWPIEPVIVRAEHRMREFLDTHAPNVYRTFDREGLMALRHEIVEAHPELAHALSELRHRTIELALARSGHDEAESRRLAKGAFDAFLDARHDIQYFEDTLDVLDYLHRHYTLGALSNGNADIARLGLDRYFSFHLSAERVGRPKPHPKMFEDALQIAGVGPEQAVHVGDHPRDDVLGAHQAGLATIWVNRLGAPPPEDMPAPTWEVASLSELRDVLAV